MVLEYVAKFDLILLQAPKRLRHLNLLFLGFSHLRTTEKAMSPYQFVWAPEKDQ